MFKIVLHLLPSSLSSYHDLSASLQNNHDQEEKKKRRRAWLKLIEEFIIFQTFHYVFYFSGHVGLNTYIKQINGPSFVCVCGGGGLFVFYLLSPSSKSWKHL